MSGNDIALSSNDTETLEFPVIGSNLKSYVNDFKNLVTNFDEQDKDAHTDNVTDAKKGGELINVKV